MATIAININSATNITVNLTNTRETWAKRNFRSAQKAFEYAAGLQTNGHQTNQFSEPEFVRLAQLAGVLTPFAPDNAIASCQPSINSAMSVGPAGFMAGPRCR